MPVKVGHREIVLPGQLVAEGEDIEIKSQHTIYKVDSKYYSAVIGLTDVQNERKIAVIALEGFYFPKIDDVVIGMIADIHNSSDLLKIK